MDLVVPSSYFTEPWQTAVFLAWFSFMELKPDNFVQECQEIFDSLPIQACMAWIAGKMMELRHWWNQQAQQQPGQDGQPAEVPRLQRVHNVRVREEGIYWERLPGRVPNFAPRDGNELTSSSGDSSSYSGGTSTPDEEPQDVRWQLVRFRD